MSLSIGEQSRAFKKSKKIYKVGDKIKLIDIKDEAYQKYNGKTATIRHIDDIGQMTCNVEDGGCCTICEFYGDIFEKV